eukprot:5757874-Prymnesium_polylepis.1
MTQKPLKKSNQINPQKPYPVEVRECRSLCLVLLLEADARWPRTYRLCCKRTAIISEVPATTLVALPRTSAPLRGGGGAASSGRRGPRAIHTYPTTTEYSAGAAATHTHATRMRWGAPCPTSALPRPTSLWMRAMPHPPPPMPRAAEGSIHVDTASPTLGEGESDQKQSQRERAAQSELAWASRALSALRALGRSQLTITPAARRFCHLCHTCHVHLPPATCSDSQ